MKHTCNSEALPGDIVQQQGPQQLKSACLLQGFHILHGQEQEALMQGANLVS